MPCPMPHTVTLYLCPAPCLARTAKQPIILAWRQVPVGAEEESAGAEEDEEVLAPPPIDEDEKDEL